MPKPELEFFRVTDVGWRPAQGGLVAGLYERRLATDPASGVATRMLRFDPDTDTSAAGPDERLLRTRRLHGRRGY